MGDVYNVFENQRPIPFCTNNKSAKLGSQVKINYYKRAPDTLPVNCLNVFTPRIPNHVSFMVFRSSSK